VVFKEENSLEVTTIRKPSKKQDGLGGNAVKSESSIFFQIIVEGGENPN
jgi:hypothetical protein